jgi:DNA-binding CsgD family transcriptional regulator
MSDPNKDLSRRFTDLFSTGDEALADAVLSPEVVMYGIENLTGAIIEICRSGARPEVLRDRILSRLRRAVPFDAAFWAMVDPATLLFTRPHQHEIPPETIPYFIRNEFFEEDVNKWTALARDRTGVRTLTAATGGHLTESSRYSEIFAPARLRGRAPRRLSRVEVHALAATRAAVRPTLPTLRVRTRAGRWAVLHGSRLRTGDGEAAAVIIEEPSPAELAPVLMMAYGLTKREQKITQLVCHGLSTRELAERLNITPNTVQDHLKSIFDKTGVRSRRELVAAILQEQYMPRAMAGRPIGPAGFFASPPP